MQIVIDPNIDTTKVPQEEILNLVAKVLEDENITSAEGKVITIYQEPTEAEDEVILKAIVTETTKTVYRESFKVITEKMIEHVHEKITTHEEHKHKELKVKVKEIEAELHDVPKEEKRKPKPEPVAKIEKEPEKVEPEKRKKLPRLLKAIMHDSKEHKGEEIEEVESPEVVPKILNEKFGTIEEKAAPKPKERIPEPEPEKESEPEPQPEPEVVKKPEPVKTPKKIPVGSAKKKVKPKSSIKFGNRVDEADQTPDDIDVLMSSLGKAIKPKATPKPEPVVEKKPEGIEKPKKLPRPIKAIMHDSKERKGEEVEKVEQSEPVPKIHRESFSLVEEMPKLKLVTKEPEAEPVVEEKLEEPEPEPVVEEKPEEPEEVVVEPEKDEKPLPRKKLKSKKRTTDKKLAVEELKEKPEEPEPVIEEKPEEPEPVIEKKSEPVFRKLPVEPAVEEIPEPEVIKPILEDSMRSTISHKGEEIEAVTKLEPVPKEHHESFGNSAEEAPRPKQEEKRGPEFSTRANDYDLQLALALLQEELCNPRPEEKKKKKKEKKEEESVLKNSLLKELDKEQDFIKSLCDRDPQALQIRCEVRNKMPEIEKLYKEEIQNEARDLTCSADFYRDISEYAGLGVSNELISALDWAFVSSLMDNHWDVFREFRWKRLEILNEEQLLPIKRKIWEKRMKIIEDLTLKETAPRRDGYQAEQYEDCLDMMHDKEINILHWQIEQGNYEIIEESEMIEELEIKRAIKASLLFCD